MRQTDRKRESEEMGVCVRCSVAVVQHNDAAAVGVCFYSLMIQLI